MHFRNKLLVHHKKLTRKAKALSSNTFWHFFEEDTHKKILSIWREWPHWTDSMPEDLLKRSLQRCAASLQLEEQSKDTHSHRLACSKLERDIELRQCKNNSIQTKIIPTLKLPRIFTTYMVREKGRQFQNWNYFWLNGVVLILPWQCN